VLRMEDDFFFGSVFMNLCEEKNNFCMHRGHLESY
jgi:hypothetical protein